MSDLPSSIFKTASPPVFRPSVTLWKYEPRPPGAFLAPAAAGSLDQWQSSCGRLAPGLKPTSVFNLYKIIGRVACSVAVSLSLALKICLPYM